MEQEILKPWQKQAISFLVTKKELANFYLTGGTALSAYYLKHRISDDLDFFSVNPIDSSGIHNLAKELQPVVGASTTRFSRLYDRNQFFYKKNNEELKIEFAHYPHKQLKRQKNFKGLMVDSEFDIAVNKLATILDRFDPKDFVDLYFLLPKFSLNKIRAGVEKKFGLTTDPIFLGGELSKARRIEALPKMLKPLTVSELKHFFEKEIKKLKPAIIE